MKQIEVTYRPVPFIPWQRTARGEHPASWEEVTGSQLLAIAGLLTGSVKEVNFLHVLTGMKKRMIKKLDEYQRFKLTELLEFTQTRNPHNSFILQKIMASGLPFSAPKPKLKGMPFGQFVFTDTLFGNYQENKSKHELYRFMAALYTPEGEPFNEVQIERNAPLMEKTKPETREAVVINYLLIKQWLIKTYPLLFVAEESFDSAQDDKESHAERSRSGRDPMVWIKIFENLVGNDIVNENKYATLPVHTVLRFISRRIKENMRRPRTPKGG